MRKGFLPLIGALALVAGAQAASAATILYSGAYTSGTSKGIYAFRFNEKTGALTPLGLVAETSQPAHIWASRNGKFLYTVNWEKAGGVSAYAVDPKTGKLTFLNRVSAKGDLPNQVMLDPTGKIAVSVNYDTGNVVAYKVLPDGKLSESFWSDQHTGKPLSARQPGPRAHGIIFSPDGKYMYIAQLGLDRVYAYSVDSAKGTITPGPTPYVNTHPGAGPRRLQIAPNGKTLYVDHETDSEVSVFKVDGTTLTQVQVTSTLPADFKERNSNAEIELDKAGKHLYVSNRGHDSIAVFDVQPDGTLWRTAIVPSGARTPRNLRIDPTGNFLISANENGGNLTVFKIDRATGALTNTGNTAAVDKPGGVYFVKTN